MIERILVMLVGLLVLWNLMVLWNTVNTVMLAKLVSGVINATLGGAI